MLQLDQVRITLGDFTLSADFTLQSGEKLALIGPSGAGKSTLLAAIAGFQPLTSGRILWRDQPLHSQPPAARPVSILFQDNNLFGHLTLAQNLGLGLRPTLRHSAAEQQQIDAALKRVGLAGMGARRPADLSGGQQSRAALARVLLQRRPVLLLDEPFAALGPALRADMLDLVAELTTEAAITLIMVTHAPEDARRLCPLCTLVAEGQAQPPVGTGAFFDTPPAALRAYLGSPPAP
jgi:thiamine transport system ATP-binding protein